MLKVTKVVAQEVGLESLDRLPSVLADDRNCCSMSAQSSSLEALAKYSSMSCFLRESL